VADPYRILVTSSRDWREPLVIWLALDECHAAAAAQGRPLVVVHGDNGAGDMIGKLYGHLTDGASEESHPADWDGRCGPQCKPGHRRKRRDGTDYCPAAGMYRNEDMVKAGADRAAAFIRRRSRGVSGCARLAEKAGIPTRRYTDDG